MESLDLKIYWIKHVTKFLCMTIKVNGRRYDEGSSDQLSPGKKLVSIARFQQGDFYASLNNEAVENTHSRKDEGLDFKAEVELKQGDTLYFTDRGWTNANSFNT